MKNRVWIWLVALALITAGCTTDKTQTVTASKPVAATKQEHENKNRIKAKVTKVSDGDTIKVDLNGKIEDVRLLLVDTPETQHPGKPVQPFGPEASEFSKKTLDGKEIELELDVSEREKYGRLLAYVWIGDKMFNEMLLEEGLARVAYVYPPNIKYVDHFREVQDKARKAEIGIWSIENYATDAGFDDTVAENQTNSYTETMTTVYTVNYKNCKAAKDDGAAPLRKGDPGYSSQLDRDGDGVACE
ncbi:thermonuclease family protein [Paenibacillus agilis]|uniref:Nuclease n=1 Tax=Paenibacillus agilis TaxID=3020863 RepID=A0A559J418_9BACL|nr:thermonuclease family protein [Paenibacillus agilis]TVX94640.1 nuclease [Paenibacillus agilis]